MKAIYLSITIVLSTIWLSGCSSREHVTTLARANCSSVPDSQKPRNCLYELKDKDKNNPILVGTIKRLSPN